MRFVDARGMALDLRRGALGPRPVVECSTLFAFLLIDSNHASVDELAHSQHAELAAKTGALDAAEG